MYFAHGIQQPIEDIKVKKKPIRLINPNWREAGHFYPPCNFGIGQLTFLEVKIEINPVNLTPCQAHWVL